MTPKWTKVLILLMMSSFSLYAQNGKFPFENDKLDFNTRVNDLVSRMTLEEKTGQMLNTAPAIPRLNVPAYDW